MKGYDYNGSRVLKNGRVYIECFSEADAVEAAEAMSNLLARAEQAERDRDVLGRALGHGKPVKMYEMRDAMSRCSPPESEESPNA